MYGEGGKFLSSYLDDKEVYGASSGENHPLMQQFYLTMFELGYATKGDDAGKENLRKYAKVVEDNNQLKQKVDGKISIFMIEPKFQELQHLYYSGSKQGSNALYNSKYFEEKIKEMDMI